jgi:imidazolonepropionase-like amidohydrolase
VYISHSLAKIAVCISTVSLFSCVSPALQPDKCDLAIKNVAVVDVIDAVVTENQTVRIGNGTILAITPETDRNKGGCSRIIDATGQFLAPGLNDAHVHLETEAFTQAFGLPPTKFDHQAAMAIYLAHGVTGVRVLSGGADILAFRDASKNTATPLLQVSSPMLSGAPPVMPEPITKIVRDAPAARAAVIAFLDQGYDFIKIRSNLEKDTFAAILDEALARGAYVDGHLTRAIGPSSALASTQKAFAHLDEFAGGVSGPDDVRLMTEEIADCDCFITSALGVTKNIIDQLEDYDAMIARDEITYLHPVIVDTFWRKPNNPYFAQGAPVAFFQGLHQRSVTLFTSLIQAGAPIVAGTDAMNPMIIPGLSLHDELAIMTDAGLTPIEALRTATLNVSENIPGFENVGVLESGRRANAVLVLRNPLDDLAVLRRPDAVIVNGIYLDRSTLDASLARAAATRGSKQ